jgi:hypothetical protein
VYTTLPEFQVSMQPGEEGGAGAAGRGESKRAVSDVQGGSGGAGGGKVAAAKAKAKVAEAGGAMVTFESSFRASGRTLYMLGLKELRVARLQRWQERLEGLVVLG